MALRTELPHVVIVGRTNVGKSTFFNRLAPESRSIAFNREGVTRDFLTDVISWQGRSFVLIDTGGMMTKKTVDELDIAAQKQLLVVLERADLFLFMCDGTIGLTMQDREIATRLHTYKKPTGVLVNKADNKSHYSEHLAEFERLGFKPVIPISAEHGIGIADALEFVVDQIEEKKFSQEDDSCRVVLLGKPNTGKSSLMNLLLKKERSIVSDVPGTTRESIVEHINFYSQDICLIDTAGVRKKRAVTDPVEQLMVKSTLYAVKYATIVLLMVDASEGQLVDQELKLAFNVFEEQYRSLIILFNKQDIVDDYAQSRMESSLDHYKELINKVETLSISCKTGKNIGRILPLVNKIWERTKQRFTEEELTLFFKEMLIARPLYRNETMLTIRRVSQMKNDPITLVIYTNMPRLFLPSHVKFFENQLRKKYDLVGVPVKFLVRR